MFKTSGSFKSKAHSLQGRVPSSSGTDSEGVNSKRKTIYSIDSLDKPVVKFSVDSPWSDKVGGWQNQQANSSKVNGGSVVKRRNSRVPVNSKNKKGLNFGSVLFGDGDKLEDSQAQEKIGTEIKKSFKDKVGGVEVRFDDDLEEGAVKWNSRRNKRRLDVSKNISRKEFAKKLAKISRSSSSFREYSGLGRITHSKEQQLNRAMKKNRRKIEKTKRVFDKQNIGSKSSRRKMTLGDMLKK